MCDFIIWWAIIAEAVISAILCISSKWFLAKKCKVLLSLGAICRGFGNALLFFLCLVLATVTVYSYGLDRGSLWIDIYIGKSGFVLWIISHTKLLIIITLSGFLIHFVRKLHTLSEIFTLRKEEICITRSQIAILIACGLWVIAVLIFFGARIQTLVSATTIGAILSWIFKDSLQGACAFVQFRAKGMLNIGDWIKLDKASVDGSIKSISLLSIEIENWDSTTSSIPMSFLYTKQLQNLQKMNDGRTNGRRMIKELIIDSSWIRSLDQEDVERLRDKLGGENAFFTNKVTAGRQNSQVFREYAEYYLLSHPKVSHEPRLLVRWVEQTGEGLVLQVYAFITDTGFMEFERRQSEIIEHLVESLEWFSLKLYQSPSSSDSKSSIIYLTKKDEDEK